MPSARPREREPEAPVFTPMIGALLRLPHEAVMSRMQAALQREGFDLSETELGVFLFPGPEGRRPSDLARQSGMSRQAMNYVLSGLENRGYLQRHDADAPNGRVIRVSERGRKAIQVIRAEVRTIEREWAEHLGARRFEALRGSLHDLATWLGKLR